MKKNVENFLMNSYKETGVHESWGYVSVMIFKKEIELSKDNSKNPFSADKFKTSRDRAKFLLPGGYGPEAIHRVAYEKKLDVIECAILKSRQIEYAEDNNDRIVELNANMSEEDKQLIDAGFWVP